MFDILLIIVLVAGVFYWWDTTITNEIALSSSQQMCQAMDVQLLDGTVVRQRVWLRRTPAALVQICRLYSFEYSDDQESRCHGYVVMLGREIAETRLGKQTVH